MKRLAIFLCVVTAIALLSGCANQSVDVVNPIDEQDEIRDEHSFFPLDTAESNIQDKISEPTTAIIEAFDENEYVPIPTTPHPFATALREYMENYDGVVRAYFATLDDDGTIGALTTRPTTRVLVDYDLGEYDYGPSGMLFYMQDGELFQIDVSGWLFVAGKYNRLMERIYSHTHLVELIYKLEFGRLEISTRLEYFSDEYLSMLFDDYEIVRDFIVERDAFAEYAREKYGLVAMPSPTFGHIRNTQDQTAQILAMTTGCVPSLNH